MKLDNITKICLGLLIASLLLATCHRPKQTPTTRVYAVPTDWAAFYAELQAAKGGMDSMHRACESKLKQKRKPPVKPVLIHDHDSDIMPPVIY